MKNVICIVGPTGVGKTKLSIELAKKLNGEVINADSTQVYKGMDIATAKVTKEEKENISGSLTIPNITAIDAYYLRGQKITPTVDEINNVTTYPFTITTNEDWTFIFEFVPSNEARVQMALDFEEPIPDIYDGIYTIKFVNPEAE